VEVRYGEGIANHIGPEPCGVTRKGGVEASAGDRIGQPLSRESHVKSGADTVLLVEGNTAGGAIASTRTARRGRRPWHVRTLLAREPGYLTSDRGGAPLLVRIGKARSRIR
jgi:hypothetical protein